MNFPLGKRLRNNFLEIPLEYSTHYLKWGHYGTYWTSIHLNFYKEPPENILLDNKQGQRLYSKAWVMLKCLINHSFYCRKLVEIKKKSEDLQRCTFQGSARGSDPFLDGCLSLCSGACWTIIHNTNHQDPAVHLRFQNLWSLTPTCCCHEVWKDWAAFN